MISMKMGQEEALNMANASLFKEFDGGSLTVDVFAVDERVAGLAPDLGFQHNGIAEVYVEHVDSKHLETI